MKIVIDENIEFAKEAFSSLGEILLINGREIDSNHVSDSDALIVRSVTEVNENLLNNSKIKFVGTATIGTDHINQTYLKNNGIAFSSAAGCNSYAVAEYVTTVLTNISYNKGISFPGKTIGIFGHGNIGSKVSKFAESMGLEVKISDPPLERAGIKLNYAPIQEVLNCDFVTFHVPLNLEGIDKTFHLINIDTIKYLKEGAVLINSSRGAVVDNKILSNALNLREIYTVLDVWENEPDISIELLNKIDLGSPHVAGYTLEGKVNGTLIVREKLLEHFKLKSNWVPNLPKPANPIIKIECSDNIIELLNSIFTIIYNPNDDFKNMSGMCNIGKNKLGKYFDGLRKNYKLRREFNNYNIILNKSDKFLEGLLRTLRFNVEVDKK